MSSSPIPVPIGIPMDSAFSVTATMALFKPLNNHYARGRTRPLLQLRHRLNSSASIMPLRCSAASSGGGDDSIIILNVGGMMCEGCAANVKRILESQPQVSSATVNLTSGIAVVWPVSEEKTAPNWQNQLGEALAQHVTSCGFSSSLRGQEDSD